MFLKENFLHELKKPKSPLFVCRILVIDPTSELALLKEIVFQVSLKFVL
jgi:hypothetical protein